MKNNLTFFLLGASLIVLLCGCRPTKDSTPEVPPQPTQPEAGEEPLDITPFSFLHSGSSADDCFLLELTREGLGTHLRAEQLVSGGNIVDTLVGRDVLDQLGELAGTYHVDRWDGFDKTNQHVMDGSSFTLNLTLADGRTISARGSNRFPEHYSEVYAVIRALYQAQMEQPPECGAVTNQQDPNAPKAITSTEIVSLSTRFFWQDADADEYSQGSHYIFMIEPDDHGGWLLSSAAPTQHSACVDESVLRRVQSLISAYDLVSLNGRYHVTAGLPPEYSPASLSVDYASGEHLEFTVDGAPDMAWCAAFQEYFINILDTLAPEGGNAT